MELPINPDFPYYLAEADLIELVEGSHARAESDWDIFLSFAAAREVAPGDILIKQFETEAAIYVLTRGRLEVRIQPSPEHSSQRVAVVEPIAIIGEHGFLDGGPRTASLVATTPGTVHRLTRDAFDLLRREHPDIACAFMFDIARTMCQRARVQ